MRFCANTAMADCNRLARSLTCVLQLNLLAVNARARNSPRVFVRLKTTLTTTVASFDLNKAQSAPVVTDVEITAPPPLPPPPTPPPPLPLPEDKLRI